MGEFEEHWRIMKEGFASIPVQVYIGMIAMIVAYVFVIKFMRNRKKRNRRLEKAVQRGHVVHARRIKYCLDDISDINSHYSATYAYEVEGSSYKYHFRERIFPPLELPLYYINNPRQAFHGLDKGASMLDVFLTFVPWIVAVLVIMLLGGV